MNPLLQTDGLPDYFRIQPADVVPALTAELAACRAGLARLLAQPRPTFENLIEPFEAMHHRLSRVFAPVSHLNAVASGLARVCERAGRQSDHRGLSSSGLRLGDDVPSLTGNRWSTGTSRCSCAVFLARSKVAAQDGGQGPCLDRRGLLEAVAVDSPEEVVLFVERGRPGLLRRLRG